jgi:hypothetical protein
MAPVSRNGAPVEKWSKPAEKLPQNGPRAQNKNHGQK